MALCAGLGFLAMLLGLLPLRTKNLRASALSMIPPGADGDRHAGTDVAVGASV